MQPTVSPLSLAKAKPIWHRNLEDGSYIQPFFAFEWYQLWLIAKQPEWQDYLLLIDSKTIAPFVRQGHSVQFIHAFTDFNDLIGPVDSVWPALLDYLKQDGVKRLELKNVLAGSATVSFFNTHAASYPDSVSVEPANSAPFIYLPKSFNSYLVTIPIKRKKYNKFKREYPTATITVSNQPEKDIDILVDLMKKIPLKQSSFSQEKELFFKSMAKKFKPLVQLQLLAVDGTTIGAQCLFTDKRRMMLYISGYDRERYTNAGTYLIISAIERAIQDGYQTFSFLKGKESYKYEMGAQDLPLYHITVEF